jgi:predicted O-methyltransferase YrrM
MSHHVWSSVDKALETLFVDSDDDLDAVRKTSAEAGLPDIAVSPNLGKFLSLLVAISGAKRVLEIGTLGGYSTIWLARSLPPGGTITTLELDETCASVAQQNLARAGLDHLAEIRVGPAADGLRDLASEGVEPFDLVFVDADKESYPTYLSGALALSRPGTVIIADNVVRDGAVFDAQQSDPDVDGLRDFLNDVSANPRLSAVGLQTVGSKGYDGIAIARVLD